MNPAIATGLVLLFVGAEIVGLAALTFFFSTRRLYLLRIAFVCTVITALLAVALIAAAVAKYRSTRAVSNSPVKVLTHVQSHATLPC